MSAEILLYVIIGIVVFDYLFGTTLDILNLRNIRESVPPELADIYDPEKYREAMKYQRTNYRFDFLTGGLGFIVSLIMLGFGLFGWLDGVMRELVQHPVLLPLAYFLALFIVSDILTLPFQWYRTFVIEEKFGFNTMTARLFITDKLKGYLLSLVIGGALGYSLIWLILEIGPDFWIYFLGIASAFIILVQLFYSTLIIPLFNKLSPLEEGELKDSISEYSRKTGFALTNIFVIDGSKRSKKANAFFMGLGRKKKVVLYDTLIQNHSNEELVAVLAHEVGHYKKKHIISGLLLSLLQIAFTLFILSLFVYNEGLSLALGGDQMAVHLNLIAFGILYSPISKLTGILMNILSRKNEFEADAYARETYGSEPLKTALKKLSVDNLSNLYPHSFYVFIHYSHPPLLRRLEALG